MLKILIGVFFSFLSSCIAVQHFSVREHALKWFEIQKQIMFCTKELHAYMEQQKKDNTDFFRLQHQLVAIYHTQKRYKLGFGAAMLPATQSIREYLRKKTFLQIKTQEIIPIYRSMVADYKSKAIGSHLHKKAKNLQQLQALNVLNEKLFEELLQNNSMRSLVEIDFNQKSDSWLAVAKLNHSTKLQNVHEGLSWIHPVIGDCLRKNKVILWNPLSKAIVMAPVSGEITFIGLVLGKTCICIKQKEGACLIAGINKVCVAVGEHVTTKDPLGVFDSLATDDHLELRLFKGDIQLEPGYYENQ